MSKTLEERVAALESIIESLRPVDLSDRYADFTIRKSPPQWLTSGGHDFAGQPISTTSPEFCDAIASFLTWQAEKDEEQNKTYVNAKGVTVAPAVYARKDAARARAWAARLRESRRPGAAPAQTLRRQPGPAQPSFGDHLDDGSDLPF